VVEFKSAHLDGVASEFVVRSEHSCQEHPFTIEEVKAARYYQIENKIQAVVQYGLDDSTPLVE
jgi:hypothetical protein